MEFVISGKGLASDPLKLTGGSKSHQIDVAGPFPTSKRQNKLIITATDYFSK